MRKFAVIVVHQDRRWCYLIEAATPGVAEEILDRRAGASDRDQIFWSAQELREWRDAWRDGFVTVLRDRKLPEGVE